MATLEQRPFDDGQLISLGGILDVRSVADVRAPLHTLVDHGSGPILLDLGDCVVRDSTAFGLLVETLRRAARAGRPVRVVAADDRTRRLMRRARLGFLLEVPREPDLQGLRGDLPVTAGVGTLTA